MKGQWMTSLCQAKGGFFTNSIVIVFCLLLMLAAESKISIADEKSDQEAIRRGTAPVWADREQQKAAYPGPPLRHTDVSDRHESILTPKTRRSIWDDWFTQSGSTGGGSSFMGDFFSGLVEFWRVILIVVLVGVLLTVLVAIIRNSERIRDWWVPNRPALARDENIENQRAKLSDLPFELEQPVGGLFAQAERYRAAGDYSRAIIYLFSYCLVELDQAHCIRLERGKTNRVYLREIRSRAVLHDFTKDLVSVFEFVFFGKHQVSREVCDTIWSRIPQFEQQLRSAKSSEPVESQLAGVAS